MTTTWMYFPFFTCEMKCDVATFDVVDRQNAHSMTVVVRNIVELYKAVKREKELHRNILVFSISHDHRSIRIYDHYVIIDEDNTIFYRHFIHEFSFTTLKSKEKWTIYKFTKNVYDDYSLILHKKICSAIDDLPTDIDFDPFQSASFSQSESENSQQSNIESTYTLNKDDNQSDVVSSQEVISIIFFIQIIERASKKSRNWRAAKQQRWISWYSMKCSKSSIKFKLENRFMSLYET